MVDKIGPPDSLLTGPATPGGFIVNDCVIHIYWIERQIEIYNEYSSSYKECQKIEDAGYKPMPSMSVQEVWIWKIDRKYGVPWAGFAEEK